MIDMLADATDDDGIELAGRAIRQQITDGHPLFGYKVKARWNKEGTYAREWSDTLCANLNDRFRAEARAEVEKLFEDQPWCMKRVLEYWNCTDRLAVTQWFGIERAEKDEPEEDEDHAV